MNEAKEYENKFTLLFYEYFFLNGKKLKLDFNNGRVPTHVALDFIRNSLKDKIPDDSIFINDGKEIKRDEEDISYPNKLLSNLKPIHLFSESLYAKEKNENKIFSFDKLKVLEEKESFKVLEYPQKENEEEIYYKIALIGNRENNANFIDGFLHFLLDIRKEDKYRFKLENNNKTNDFISKSYIQSEKGNFQFISINLELDNSYSKEELSQMQEIFSNNLALIVFNKMDKSYEKIYRRDGTIQLIANHIYTTQKNKVFIVEPNIYLIDILFYYLLSSMEKYGGNLPINIVDEFIKTMETLKNHISTCFLDFSCIYEEKKNKYDLCLFSQAIESYSYFYQTALKGENYKRRYMGFVFYLGDISSHLEEINKKCNDYQEKKQKAKGNDLKLDEFLQELDELNFVDKNLENLYEDRTDEIEKLQQLKSTIIKNPQLLIPIGSKKNYKFYNSFFKNNVCKICRYNCHLECQCFKKRFCKCMSFTFKCKVCPNKCPNECHELSSTTFSKCEYRTIAQYLPNDNDYAKIDSTEAKFNYLIKKFEEDREEIKKKRDNIDERLKEIKDNRAKIKIDMTSLNNELNAHIKEYNNFVDSLQFSNHIEVWQEELLLYVVKPFFLKKKIYDYVDPKDDKDENDIII